MNKGKCWDVRFVRTVLGYTLTLFFFIFHFHLSSNLCYSIYLIISCHYFSCVRFRGPFFSALLEVSMSVFNRNYDHRDDGRTDLFLSYWFNDSFIV